ncbi:hypothetical protein, partial [Achromobacter sp.]
MQPLATDSVLPPAAPTGNDPRAARRDADADTKAQDPETAASDRPVSVRVVLSDDALERAAKARKAISQLAVDAAQSRQDFARSRVSQIKQRIEMLKKMLMFLGKAAAKSILQELRQLSGELGQAAAALKSSGGAAPA